MFACRVQQYPVLSLLDMSALAKGGLHRVCALAETGWGCTGATAKAAFDSKIQHKPVSDKLQYVAPGGCCYI
jgi:hypothetical protein